ncbi:uncharacterized protein DUF1638 [Primorskyibacter sedentarius]|uniref:Uncharacterized protein DUF1638 n=1 Tax=Primorskyibacter sedentarius TaxID=745311 RepID=A0A4R3J4P5_9RHOB|nr:DUF1638 domain-containing protein [Primorskyibacter sedentarius]TCS60212.1 uncharacterized protein DUF1638 [Primorskyibacter sedentarius]
MTDTFPSDDTLTEGGLPASGNGRVLVIACGALAREILALTRLNGWDHVDLQCLPAILHNHPERITDAVRQAVERHRENYRTIHVAYADCGTGGQLQAACEDMGVTMIAGPHCYSFFEGNEAFSAQAEDEFTAFYLTDFLTRQFDAFVWRPLGLDRHPQLRDSYFGHYEKLVYLAQTDDPALTETARDCAERLGLSFERRATGYGDLATTMARWAQD